MHECTSIIMNSFHLFLIFSLNVYMLLCFFNKEFVVEGGGWWWWSLNSEQNRTGGGGLSHVHSVKKIA